MSHDVLLKGFVAVLRNPVLVYEDREDLNERLWDEQSNLSTNSEGTLVYSSKANDDFYGFTLSAVCSILFDSKLFVDNCIKHNIEIVTDSIRPFHEIYYNGTDSQISQLTLEEFITK